MSTETARNMMMQEQPAAWLRKYAIRTSRGYIQRGDERGNRPGVYYLTPDLEKALMIESKGEAIQIAIRTASMKAVVKEVDIDPQTGKRKTAGTVVF